MATRRRAGVKDAENATENKPPEKKRLNPRITAEAHQKLMIHCVMSGMEPGKYLSELITKFCRDWNTPARVSVRAIVVDSAEQEHGVDLSMPVQR